MANLDAATKTASGPRPSLSRRSLAALVSGGVLLSAACGRTTTDLPGAGGAGAPTGASGSQSNGASAGAVFAAGGASTGGAFGTGNGTGSGGRGAGGSGQAGGVSIGGGLGQAGSNEAGGPGCGGDCAVRSPSCQGLADDCGPNGNESCCSSPLVPGGTFYRNYDGATFTNRTAPATVSDFRLDKYEVTVGRFRRFVAAWVDGWRPAPGSGKHAHLNQGGGLNAGTEAGWDPSWQSWQPFTTKPLFPSTLAAWNDTLSCYLTTWTPNAGANENLPVTCTALFEAYAFCIWDGGFLPTDAEWNYAASGGAEQRVYPWGSQPPADDLALAVHSPCKSGGSDNCVNGVKPQKVGSIPAGNGKYGQADLAGNLMERVLDQSVFQTPCVDCANLNFVNHPQQPSFLPTLGGSYTLDASFLFSSAVAGSWWSDRDEYIGFRCARSP